MNLHLALMSTMALHEKPPAALMAALVAPDTEARYLVLASARFNKVAGRLLAMPPMPLEPIAHLDKAASQPLSAEKTTPTGFVCLTVAVSSFLRFLAKLPAPAFLDSSAAVCFQPYPGRKQVAAPP